MAIGMIAVPWQTFMVFCLILLPQHLNIYRKLLDIMDIYSEIEDHPSSMQTLQKENEFLTECDPVFSCTVWHEISSRSFSCSACDLNIDNQIHRFVHEQTFLLYLNCTK